MAGLQFGLLLVTVMFVVKTFTPQPVGSVLMWAALAVQFAWIGLVTWNRTRLPFASAGMFLGALGMGMVAFLGGTLSDALSTSTVTALALVVLFVTASLCRLVESQRHPRKWREMKARFEQATIPDVMAGRHIPNLRHLRRADSRHRGIARLGPESTPSTLLRKTRAPDFGRQSH
jgi:uncharacterized membrane protein YccC